MHKLDPFASVYHLHHIRISSVSQRHNFQILGSSGDTALIKMAHSRHILRVMFVCAAIQFCAGLLLAVMMIAAMGDDPNANSSDFPLRFNSHGQFKILQVLFLKSWPIQNPAGTLPQIMANSKSCRYSSSNYGQFKILQVADMHYANGATTRCLNVLPSQYTSCSDLNTTSFLDRIIAAEQPDLVVFTGDNIYGSDCDNSSTSLIEAFAPAVKAQIPWAAVLGNHDQEGNLDRPQLMQHIVQMEHTLSKLNPDSSAKIDGFGNYNIEVGGVDGSLLAHKSVLNLYFLDSGDYSTVAGITGYGWIKISQQSWFKEVSAQLKAAYMSRPVPQNASAPGLVYFHIPLPEFSECGVGNMTGVKQEAISSPSLNSGFLGTMTEAGDVKAAFVGHDHINDFCGHLNGVNLCYGGGFGYHGYGEAGWSRRSRVVVASLEKKDGEWMGVNNITTWKRLDDAALTTIDMQVLWTSSSPTTLKQEG